MPKLVKKGGPTPEFLPAVLRLGELADATKAKNIRAYNIQGLTLIADALVLCTATSEPQMKAVYSRVREGMSESGRHLLRSEGTTKGGWLVVDYGDVIFHLFREEARDYYDLDGLWADAPMIDLGLEVK